MAALLLISQGVVLVPDGAAGVSVSPILGVLPGRLYPGVHGVTPIDRVALCNTREQVCLHDGKFVGAEAE